MKIERPEFPSIIDSSTMAHFRACPKMHEYSDIHHWKTSEESVHLVAGGAYAKGIEITRLCFWGLGLTADQSIGHGLIALLREYGDFEPNEDSPKTAVNMALALYEYFLHYGLNTDSIQPLMIPGVNTTAPRPAVEFTFALPLAQDLLHPVTKDPILYAGRFDLIGQFQGALFGVDEKTTTQLGGSWAKRWVHRSQFTGYVWAARESGYPLAGVIARGVAILKKSFTHAESIQYRPQWQVDRWLEQSVRDIRRMISSWEEGYYDVNLSDSCNNYGGCPYLQVCSSPQPLRWLEAEFIQRKWDPLA